MKRFVITGIGRSGTKYTSELLTAAGIPCSWEKVFRTNSRNLVWTPTSGDASWLAAPFLSKLPEGTIIFHQTRDPLKWANSWLKVSQRWGPAHTNFIDDNCGFFRWRDGSHPTVDMKLYVVWNEMIEEAGKNPKFTYVRYKVEDFDSRKIMEISDLVKQPILQLKAFESYNKTSKSVNASSESKTYVPVTWDTLPQGVELDNFKAMALKYGYTTT
jgi:hypothetical protein